MELPKEVMQMTTKKTGQIEFINKKAMDGVDHINIDNGCAKTELGKQLAINAKVGFEHPLYGPFASVEGFWHWVRASPESRSEFGDAIRSLHGDAAKFYAKNHLPYVFIENFKQEVISAIYYKVMQNKELYSLLISSDLPITTYYQYGPMQIEISNTAQVWVCQGIEQIRAYIKSEEPNKEPFKFNDINEKKRKPKKN